MRWLNFAIKNLKMEPIDNITSGGDATQLIPKRMICKYQESDTSIQSSQPQEYLCTQQVISIPHIPFSKEMWAIEFPNALVQTPLCKVKIGDNQYQKMIAKGRQGQFGMIKPTLTNPDYIIEVPSKSREGHMSERPSSMLFIKSFIGKDNTRSYFFKSVTVLIDGMEVNVSNHIDRPKRIYEALKNGKLRYRFDGGAQTEQLPTAASGATSQTMSGVHGSKGSVENSDTQE